jgi:hypothetical protein
LKRETEREREREREREEVKTPTMPEGVLPTSCHLALKGKCEKGSFLY